MTKLEQINQIKEITSESLEDKIFELEKEIDARKTFIQTNKEASLKSESLKSRIDSFEIELKDLNIQLIKTCIQLHELKGE